MNLVTQLIKSREAKAGTVGVVAYALLLGYFVWYTFFGYTERTYPVTWQAPWITYSEQEISQSYFRKKIYLSQKVRHAWIKVMAPDNFTVYVNGTQQGKATLRTDNATEYFSLTTALRAGTNVLAISTHRTTFPGTSKIVVEGAYEDWQGNVHKLLSDESWKVNQYDEWQLSGGPRWFEVNFNDAHWKYAEVTEVPQPEDNSKVSYSPLIYTEKLRGQWMWSSLIEAKRVYLRYPFHLAAKPKDAWISIAGQGYHLIINGISIADKQQLVGVTGAVPRAGQTLNTYNVTPLLTAGLNTVAVSAFAERSDSGILVHGIILDPNGNPKWISSPEGWKTSTVESNKWTSPSFDDSHWAPALTKAILPDGDSFKLDFADPTPSDSYLLAISIKKTLCLLLTTLFVILFWVLSATLFSRLREMELLKSLILTSLLYPVPLLFLVVVLLLSFDLRYDSAFAFQERHILISLGLSLLSLALLFIRGNLNRPGLKDFRYKEVTAVIIIALLGLVLRLTGIDYKPLGGDETSMALVSPEVWNRGFPAITVAPSIPDKYVTTSEMIPYFIALSMKLFPSKSIEFQIRFPGVIFGTLTIVLLYLMGRTLFSEGVGLLAAILYAIMPLAINMSQFARYPEAVQFFTLLSAYGFYRAFSSEKRLNGKYLFIGGVANVLAYLSWEGMAFFFPALGVGLVVLRGRDLSWMKSKYLWLAVGALVLVLYLQLGFRYTINRGLLTLGSGVSGLTLTERWDQPLYNPFIFIYNFFLMKNIILLTLIGALGLPLALRDKRLFYCYCLAIIPVVLTTNLVEVHDFRHIYYVLAFAVLGASAVFLRALDYLLFNRASPLSLETPSIIPASAKMGFVTLLILTGSDHFLKLYNMPMVRTGGANMVEYGDNGGIRQVAEILRNKMRPGDKVVAQFPHILYLYYGKAEDYFAQNPLQSPVLVDNAAPRAVHRLRASPLIYSPDEMKDFSDNHHRIWFVSKGPFTPESFNLPPHVYDRFRENLSPVFEDFGIWLYLLEQ